MNLSQVLDTLRQERSHSHVPCERPKGRKCKFCNTHLAVRIEEPTIVHVRNFVTNEVKVECLYNGKHYCQMCHRYQV